MRFYRDVLGFPVVHSICAAGWGPDDHPDFIHFFFDIGGGDRLAFFYYFNLPQPDTTAGLGDVYARFPEGTPDWFVRSRHLALHVDSEEHMLEYRRRLDGSEWPVEMQIQHETIESIYTHDPNGYMVEITRPTRPVTPQEDLDANLTIDALVRKPGHSMDDLLIRKAELIVERAEAWTRAGGPLMGGRLFMLDVPENTPIVEVARHLPEVKVGTLGPYLVIESEAPISIDRRATGVRSSGSERHGRSRRWRCFSPQTPRRTSPAPTSRSMGASPWRLADRP